MGKIQTSMRRSTKTIIRPLRTLLKTRRKMCVRLMLIIFHAWYIVTVFIASATPYTVAFVTFPAVDHIHASVDVAHAADRYIIHFVRFFIYQVESKQAVFGTFLSRRKRGTGDGTLSPDANFANTKTHTCHA